MRFDLAECHEGDFGVDTSNTLLSLGCAASNLSMRLCWLNGPWINASFRSSSTPRVVTNFAEIAAAMLPMDTARFVLEAPCLDLLRPGSTRGPQILFQDAVTTFDALYAVFQTQLRDLALRLVARGMDLAGHLHDT